MYNIGDKVLSTTHSFSSSSMNRNENSKSYKVCGGYNIILDMQGRCYNSA